MGHRTFVMLIGAIIILKAQVAFALGLGDITLKSSLNQPLLAEIQLLEVRDLAAREVLVSLASQEDFDRVGVDRPYFLAEFRYEVKLGTPKGDVIVVTSRKPVLEPFLNFIVQVRWPSGKILREYTLLMDLPVFTDQKAAPVTAAQTSNSVSKNTPAKQAPSSKDYVPRSSFGEQNQAAPSATGNVSSNAGVDVYGPVKANDTLWEIAASVRPDRSVSVQQTMLAIQEVNPNAFINNNINLLKKGQILRIPSRDQIREFNKRQAVAEVAQQNNVWSGGAVNSEQAAQLDGSKSYKTTEPEVVVKEGRVKLSSPEEAYNASEGRGTGVGESSTDALENELAITLEQLDKSGKENTELRSKVQSLEEQIKTMERMIAVSNDEMRALELSIQKTKNAAKLAEENAQLASSIEGDIESTEVEEQSSAETVIENSIVDTSEMTEASNDAESMAAVAESTPEPTAIPTPAPTKAVAKVVRRMPKEKGIVDLLMDNIIYLGLGLIAILALIAFVIRQRANAKEFEEDDDYLDEPVFDEPLFDETEELLADDVTDDDVPESAEYEEQEEKVEEEAPTTESETGDVVAEADIYIAYGKYDQAEEMLAGALKKDPSNANIYLKLLEVYASQQDINAFDPLFGKLIALKDDESTDRGYQLRNGISSAPEFDASQYEVNSTSSVIEGLDDDFDASTDDELSFELDSSANESLDTELSLDFDLNDEINEDQPSSDDSLELDLNFDSDNSASDLDDTLDLDLDLDLETEVSADPLENDVTVIRSLAPAEESAVDSAEQEDEFDFDLELDAELGSEDTTDEISLDVDSGLTLNDEDGALDFDLELDLDEELEDATESDLDLTFETSGENEAGSDLGDLDFDLGALDDTTGITEDDEEDLVLDFEASESETSLADELDALEFDLDTGDDIELEGDSAEDDADFDLSDIEENDDSGDLGSLEFDLDGLDDLELESDDELLDTSADESINADVVETPALNVDSAETDDEGSDFDFEGLDELEGLDDDASDLGDLDDVDDELLDFDLVESSDSKSDSKDSEDAEIDELGELTDDLDLSSLDDELDALTSDLEMGDSDLASLGLEDEDLGSSAEADAPVPQPTVMEEPVTDFDDFELDDLDDTEGSDELGDIDIEDLETLDAEDVGASLDDELDLDEDVTLETPVDLEDVVVDEEDDDLLEGIGEDTMFNQALSDIPDTDLDFEIPEVDPESLDEDGDLGFLNDSDETATKLDLARAYIDMGDDEGARDILDEIRAEGNEQQKQEADKLAERLDK